MNADSFEALLREFGRRAEITDIDVDEDGYCGLIFDEKVVVHIRNDLDRNVIQLVSSPGYVDPAVAAQAVQRLLAANYYWTGTGGATLGWNPHDREVQLAYAIPAENIDVDRFAEVFARFVNNLEQWRTTVVEWNRGDFADFDDAGGFGVREDAAVPVDAPHGADLKGVVRV